MAVDGTPPRLARVSSYGSPPSSGVAGRGLGVPGGRPRRARAGAGRALKRRRRPAAGGRGAVPPAHVDDDVHGAGLVVDPDPAIGPDSGGDVLRGSGRARLRFDVVGWLAPGWTATKDCEAPDGAVAVTFSTTATASVGTPVAPPRTWRAIICPVPAPSGVPRSGDSEAPTFPGRVSSSRNGAIEVNDWGVGVTADVPALKVPRVRAPAPNWLSLPAAPRSIDRSWRYWWARRRPCPGCGRARGRRPRPRAGRRPTCR